MEITLELIKQLRNKTGAGMSDCKNALVESEGNMEKAIEYLRKKGAAMAAKRADKITKEGAIKSSISDDKKSAVIIEINCETDFVSKGEEFQKFAQDIADTSLKSVSDDISKVLNAETNEGITVQEKIDSMMGSIGERIELKRIKYLNAPDGFIAGYIHFGSKLGALIKIKGNFTNESYELGQKIAMQVVAMNPLSIDRSGVSNDIIEKEKDIYRTQATNEGKTQNIIDRIVQNKVEKFYQDNCLLEQEYIQEANLSVGKLIDSFVKTSGNKIEVLEMVRYQLGG